MQAAFRSLEPSNSPTVMVVPSFATSTRSRTLHGSTPLTQSARMVTWWPSTVGVRAATETGWVASWPGLGTTNCGCGRPGSMPPPSGGEVTGASGGIGCRARRGGSACRARAEDEAHGQGDADDEGLAGLLHARQTASALMRFRGAQASTIEMEVMLTGSLGRSWEPVGAVAMASRTSVPEVSRPKIV